MMTSRHPSVPTQGSTLECHCVQHQEVGPSLPSTQGPILQRPKPPWPSCVGFLAIHPVPWPLPEKDILPPPGQATLFPPVALQQGHLYCMMLVGQLLVWPSCVAHPAVFVSARNGSLTLLNLVVVAPHMTNLLTQLWRWCDIWKVAGVEAPVQSTGLQVLPSPSRHVPAPHLHAPCWSLAVLGGGVVPSYLAGMLGGCSPSRAGSCLNLTCSGQVEKHLWGAR